MTKTEVIDILKKIKSHYQEFVIDEFKISEWYGFLKEYDAEDVNEKFNKHVLSEVYGNNIPKINYLIGGLIKSKNKGTIRQYTVACPMCDKYMPYEELEKHYHRCSSVNFIELKTRELYNKEVNKEKLYELSDEEFEKIYARLIAKIEEKDGYSASKRLLTGLYPNVSEDEINKMVENIAESRKKLFK